MNNKEIIQIRQYCKLMVVGWGWWWLMKIDQNIANSLWTEIDAERRITNELSILANHSSRFSNN